MLSTPFDHSITIGIKNIKGLDFLENMKLLSFTILGEKFINWSFSVIVKRHYNGLFIPNYLYLPQ
jgi:hypothetical protein